MTAHGAPARVALVTGAARGLGAGIVERLLRDGWQVAAADWDHREPVPVPATQHSCDVSDEGQVASLMAEVVQAHGRLDAVVCNAGIGGDSDPVEQLSLDSFRRVIEVNLVGTFLVARAAIPHLRRTAPGSGIVTLGSMFGQQAVARGSAYCASKGAITSFTQGLALELAPEGIRVNSIAPGNMLTDMHREELAMRAEEAGVSVEEMTDRVRRSVPLQRHGGASDIASAVAWLLSDDASYVTGQTISVNGGVILT